MSNVLNHKTTQKISSKVGSWSIALCRMVLIAALVQQAQAAFTGEYSLDKFTMQNSEADGSASLDPFGRLVITGGNNGSGLPGFTDLMISAPAAGIVSFSWMYFSDDIPPFDVAGYLVGPLVHVLTDTSGGSGLVSFPVNANQTFGFRIGTEDNTHEPGILTISDFEGPSGSASAVPEPGSFSLILSGVLTAIIGARGLGMNRGPKRV